MHTTYQKDPKNTPYTSWYFKKFNIMAVLISFQRGFPSFTCHLCGSFTPTRMLSFSTWRSLLHWVCNSYLLGHLWHSNAGQNHKPKKKKKKKESLCLIHPCDVYTVYTETKVFIVIVIFYFLLAYHAHC